MSVLLVLLAVAAVVVGKIKLPRAASEWGSEPQNNYDVEKVCVEYET